MTIEVGDTVRFTQTILDEIQENDPALFNKLVASNRSGGKVTDIKGSVVFIDMGDTLRGPLAVDTDGSIHHVLQLVKKGKAEDVQQTYAADTIETPSRSGPESQGLEPPMHLEPKPSQPSEDTTPARVRMAQWVIVQFHQLKQYGIAQDLHRIDDEHAPHGDLDEDDRWKQQGGQSLPRPVNFELTGQEDQAYNASLRKIQDWINDGDVDGPPGAT